MTRIVLGLRSVVEAGASREAEILALRQQLLVLSRQRRRVWLRNIDRLILVWRCRLFPSMSAVVMVKPETLLAGIVVGFEHIGAGSLGGAAAG